MEILFFIILSFALSLLVVLFVFAVKEESKTRYKTIQLMDKVIEWLNKDIEKFN